MDGGDCGVDELIGVVPSLSVLANNSHVAFETKPTVVALYVNLSALVSSPYEEIVDAVHDAPKVVRIALVNSEARVWLSSATCAMPLTW